MKTPTLRTLETRRAIRHAITPSTQVLNPTTESKRAVKQLIRYLKGTQYTCLRLEPHGMVQKVCWNSLVVVTQIGPAIRQHAKVLRDIIAMHRT